MREHLYKERDRTAFLTLNRPQVRNCLSMKLSEELIGQMGLALLLCKMSNLTHVCACSRRVSFSLETVFYMHVLATPQEKTSNYAFTRQTKRKGRNHMVYYRVALRGNHSAIWRWKSPPFNSLHGVLGMLSLYRHIPEGHIRVFLFTSIQQMDAMLQRANQGALSTSIAVKQLWDAHRTSWIEIRRLEIELGEGGDHDQPYDGQLISSSSLVLAWTKLLARRARGELI